MRLLLLPGMNGTTGLFADFLAALPKSIDAQPIGYASARPQSYAELLDTLPAPREPLAVLGESFSGPLSILYAARFPAQVRALVLVGTFARSPVPFARLFGALAGPWLFRKPPPSSFVRALMWGPEASPDEIARFQSALAGVAPEVLAARMREVLHVDVREAFASLRCPVLLVCGQRDRVVRAWNRRALQRLQPKAEVAMLDAPHLILQRRPREAAEAVARFLAIHLPP